jgi:hypothetical protein
MILEENFRAQIVLLITDTQLRGSNKNKRANNLLVILFTSISTIRALLQVLPLDTTSTAATERRPEGKVDVFLRIQTDDETGNVHQLLADTVKVK